MIEKFLAENAYTVETKRTYKDILARFISDHPDPRSINAVELINYVENIGWGNARQCLALACIQSFLRWQWGASQPALSAKIKRVTGKLQRAVTADQLDKILASFNRHTPKGARDLAIASLMIQSGFRCAEVCRLQQADTNTVSGIAQVIVKGSQWRIGVFNTDTAAHLEHWKRYRETLNPQGGFLFVSLKKQTKGKKITPEGLNKIITVWGENLQIKLSPHDFRRGFATQTGENGSPDFLIMRGGGWHDQNAFNRYTRTASLQPLRQYLPQTKLVNNEENQED